MPSTTDRRALQVGLATISVLVFAYSIVIVQQILLGVVAVVFCWLLYVLWRFLNVLERIATALERDVAEREDRRRRQDFGQGQRSDRGRTTDR